MNEQEMNDRLIQLEAAYSSNTGRFGERLDGHDNQIAQIGEKLENILEKLSARPTWLITILLTGLTTIASSLIVFVATNH